MRLNKIFLPFILLFSCSAALAKGIQIDRWHQRETPHFKIHHESPKLYPDMIHKLESLHSRLKLHLGGFAPWMDKDKIKVYIYKTAGAYHNGEFQPPPWSQAVADLNHQAIVFYEQKDKENLWETLAHELTHLFFEDYFRQSKTSAPKWLTEGLAMLMEEEGRSKAKKSPRLAAMKKFLKEKPKSLEYFFESGPSEHASSKDASEWYLKAYSVTRFLYHRHSRLKFKVLCDKLRSGEELEKALWLAYRIRNFKTLHKDWQAWLNNPS